MQLMVLLIALGQTMVIHRLDHGKREPWNPTPTPSPTPTPYSNPNPNPNPNPSPQP